MEYVPTVDNYEETLLALLSQPTIASKEWVYEQYDYMVRTNTVVAPGSDAAVLRIRGTNKALAMTTDCNSRYVYLDPEVGGKIAIAEAARNIVCSGAQPLAVTDCLNFGNPEKPEIFWQLEKAVDGMSEACRILETPVISGNVSLYNETNGEAIYPTPIVGMVGIVEHVDHITTQAFKQPGDLIYIIGEAKQEFGGSELQKWLTGRIFGKAPTIDLHVEVKRQQQLLTAIRAGVVASAHDVSEGGLAVALAECVMSAQGLGARVEMKGDVVAELFSETQSRFIVSVKKEHQQMFERLVQAVRIGEVTNDGTLHVTAEDTCILHVPVETMRNVWKGAIPCLLKSKD